MNGLSIKTTISVNIYLPEQILLKPNIMEQAISHGVRAGLHQHKPDNPE